MTAAATTSEAAPVIRSVIYGRAFGGAPAATRPSRSRSPQATLSSSGRPGPPGWQRCRSRAHVPAAFGYTFLFLLPGLLAIRRDYAILLSTLFLGVYHGIAWWIAFVMVVYLLLASTRWTWLRRPDDGVRNVAAADPEPTALEVAPA
jgi:hypothetical protein